MTTGYHTWVGTVFVGGKSFSSDAESSKPKARESAAKAALRELIGVVDIGLEEVDAKCELLVELRADLKVDERKWYDAKSKTLQVKTLIARSDASDLKWSVFPSINIPELFNNGHLNHYMVHGALYIWR